MKRHIFIVTGLATALSFSACNPQVPPRKQTAATKPSDAEQTRRTHDVDAGSDETPAPKKVKADVPPDPEPVVRKTVPDAPKVSSPEYALKADKPGYVRSPYDSEHRLIDVRGLPPGTEAECPYTHRTFLVPP